MGTLVRKLQIALQADEQKFCGIKASFIFQLSFVIAVGAIRAMTNGKSKMETEKRNNRQFFAWLLIL